MSETELAYIPGLSANHTDYNILFSVISTGFFADAPARGGGDEAPVDPAASPGVYRVNLGQAVLSQDSFGRE